MKKPNIVFILIDDLGWRDLVCYGSNFYETPNIDRLASEGLKFTDAYAACPVCSPSRASILSGKYPATLGVTDYIDWMGKVHPCRGRLIDAPYVNKLPLSEKSLASALKEGGYNTWHVGKWHLGGEEFWPERHGFDVNIGGCDWGLPLEGYFSPYGIETLEDGPAWEFLTDRLTDEAIKLIRNNNGNPFYLNLCHYAVHIPLEAKEEDIRRFEKKVVDMGLDKVKEFEEGESFPTELKKHLKIVRRLVQSDPMYAAMIYNLDWNLGRLLNVLEETGQAENTIVIFTSDNGGTSTAEGSPTCNAPLGEGKGWMYEGGVRVPLVIRWPGKIKQAGTICTDPVTSPDFYPTLLEAAELPLIPEQHVDGMSFLPLLRENGRLDREAIFWHYPHYGMQGGTPGSSIRMGDYKLIEFFEDGRLELYNLREDIDEEYNLISDMPVLTEEMKMMLDKWRRKVNAKFPQINSDFI